MSTGSVVPDSILQIASGFMAAKLLFVANEIGLFTSLAEGGATLDDLEEEARGWLETAGWRALERKALVGPMSVVVAATG